MIDSLPVAPIIRPLAGPDLASAADYVSWVIYPDDKDARRGFLKVAIAQFYKYQGIHPVDALKGLKTERIEPKIRRGLEVIATRRAPAAFVFLQRCGGVPMAQSYKTLLEAEHPPYSDADAIKRLVWRTSRLALAMTIPICKFRIEALSRFTKAAKPGLDWRELLLRSDWVDNAVRQGYELAPWIAKELDEPVLIPGAITPGRVERAT